MSFLIAFVVSSTIALLLVKVHTRYSHFGADYMDGVQKIHTEPTSRIGGLAIFFGVLAGFMVGDSMNAGLFIALLPLFIVGIIEDFTGKIPPSIRLLASFASAGMAIYLLDMTLTNIGWGWFDDMVLSIYAVSVGLTVLMIGGVAHATNIIDGLNGLLLGYTLLVLSTLLWVSVQVDDTVVQGIVLTTLGAVLGLFIFNFPNGKIFTGDGGAYFIGCLLAIIALLLAERNAQVSPWSSLLVMIYPIFETFFSAYRRRLIRQMSPTLPDNMHLHMLVYKRLTNYYQLGLVLKLNNNATSSVLLWLCVLPFMLPLIFWWDNPLIMIVTIILFCVAYTLLYFAIVRFRLHKIKPRKR